MFEMVGFTLLFNINKHGGRPEAVRDKNTNAESNYDI